MVGGHVCCFCSKAGDITTSHMFEIDRSVESLDQVWFSNGYLYSSPGGTWWDRAGYLTKLFIYLLFQLSVNMGMYICLVFLQATTLVNPQKSKPNPPEPIIQLILTHQRKCQMTTSEEE